MTPTPRAGGGAPPLGKPLQKPQKQWSDRKFGLVLLSPAIALIMMVSVLPIGLAFYYSMHDTSYLNVREFVGTGNFAELFSDGRFYNSVAVSLKYVLGSLAMAFLIALPLAASLTSSGRGITIARTIVFLPWVISQVVTGLLWVWLLNPSFGPISSALGAAGLPAIDALSNPDTAVIVIIIANVWASYPLATVLLLAAMQSIGDELYDAAAIDGCGPWKSFVHITLPGISSALAMTAINLTVYYFNMVTLIYTMTGGGPLRSTETLSLRIYLEAFQGNNLAAASAYGVIALLLNMAFAVTYIRVLRRSADS